MAPILRSLKIINSTWFPRKAITFGGGSKKIIEKLSNKVLKADMRKKGNFVIVICIKKLTKVYSNCEKLGKHDFLNLLLSYNTNVHPSKGKASTLRP